MTEHNSSVKSAKGRPSTNEKTMRQFWDDNSSTTASISTSSSSGHSGAKSEDKVLDGRMRSGVVGYR